MKKPLRCWLTFHDWRVMVNDEDQRYKPAHAVGHNADRVDGPNWSALAGVSGRVGYVDRGCAQAGLAL
jgi:hypothetical protein